MGWNRGLGRRTLGRLNWDTEQQPRPPSDNYVKKKVRMNENKVAKTGKVYFHEELPS